MMPVAADALDLAVLQRPQQLGLHRQRQLADLVEKQRAFVRQFELADAVVGGARKGAALMAEQLALGDRFGQGGTVEIDHRLLPAGGVAVNHPRHQLLADAGLTQDQRRQVGGGHGLRFALELGDGGALADQFVGCAVVWTGALDAVMALELFLEAHDPVGSPHRRGRHGYEGAKHVRIDGIEAARCHRVEGDHTPRLAVDVQRRAHTVMHVEMLAGLVDQAVVGVGQGGVGRKAHRLGAVHDLRQPGLIADDETPAQGVGAEPAHGARHQLVAVAFEQGDGIARKAVEKGFEQARIALLPGHRLGQVGHGAGQVEEGGVCCH